MTLCLIQELLGLSFPYNRHHIQKISAQNGDSIRTRLLTLLKQNKNKSETEKEKQTSLLEYTKKIGAFQIFLNENMLLAPI